MFKNKKKIFEKFLFGVYEKTPIKIVGYVGQAKALKNDLFETYHQIFSIFYLLIF